MSNKDDAFLKRLLATFRIEAEEHLRAMSRGLVELEKAPDTEKQLEVLETVFREAHSLKGAARAVNHAEVESLCQSLENVFSALKQHEVAFSPALFDTLHKTVDLLGELVHPTDEEKAAPKKMAITQLLQALERELEAQAAHLPEMPRGSEIEESIRARSRAAPSAETPSPFRVEEGKVELPSTVRVSRAKLNSLMLQAEELLSVKLALTQRGADLRELAASLAMWEKERAKVQTEVRGLQHRLEKKEGGIQGAGLARGENGSGLAKKKLLEFLEWNDGLVKSLEAGLGAVTMQVEQDHRALSAMAGGLLDEMKKVLMLPFSSLLEAFPKLVRDLSRDQSKDVELVIQGAEIQVDRRILEEIKDPLIHLIRNSVDHGIETPKERERKKKPVRGRIILSISQMNGDKVEICVSDDGAGIDLAKVRASALRLGIVSQEEAVKMDEAAVLPLIFRSGVSTSRIITDISGRGLGLAIVDEKVRELGGTVSLETHPRLGTTFRIVLPLTLAAFRGVLVRAGEQLFVFPTAYVERVARLGRNEIMTVENRETISLDGKVVSLVRLQDALGLSHQEVASEPADKVHVVVLNSADKRVAFLVDEILHEQEVLVKGLGPQLVRVWGVAGAAVLGTGRVVPVLNVPDLIKSAVKIGFARVAEPAALAKSEPETRSILVVEDSITARTLLKNILESVGYRVKTAVDGVDAHTALRTEKFDLVVSDVDMPRMNGFDLTAKIRTDKKLSELPVVLVTALESRQDRERGVDVGANAYIVKSSFDQSNLLEVIRRLI